MNYPLRTAVAALCAEGRTADADTVQRSLDNIQAVLRAAVPLMKESNNLAPIAEALARMAEPGGDPPPP